jgi:hypothetical protein
MLGSIDWRIGSEPYHAEFVGEYAGAVVGGIADAVIIARNEDANDLVTGGLSLIYNTQGSDDHDFLGGSGELGVSCVFQDVSGWTIVEGNWHAFLGTFDKTPD